jgi:hypothetical protein
MQLGGSLSETVTVPIVGPGIVDVPPPQLIMMTATIAAARVTTTGIIRCLNFTTASCIKK